MRTPTTGAEGRRVYASFTLHNYRENVLSSSSDRGVNNRFAAVRIVRFFFFFPFNHFYFFTSIIVTVLSTSRNFLALRNLATTFFSRHLVVVFSFFIFFLLQIVIFFHRGSSNISLIRYLKLGINKLFCVCLHLYTNTFHQESTSLTPIYQTSNVLLALRDLAIIDLFLPCKKYTTSNFLRTGSSLSLLLSLSLSLFLHPPSHSLFLARCFFLLRARARLIFR